MKLISFAWLNSNCMMALSALTEPEQRIIHVSVSRPKSRVPGKSDSCILPHLGRIVRLKSLRQPHARRQSCRPRSRKRRGKEREGDEVGIDGKRRERGTGKIARMRTSGGGPFRPSLPGKGERMTPVGRRSFASLLTIRPLPFRRF